MTRTLFILGATGFIGRTTVSTAIETGWRVIALARSDEGAARLRAAGAWPVMGDMARPAAWIDEARGAVALLAALRGLPAADRPLLFSVNGIDDLQADGRGVVDHRSPLHARPRGFGRIGIPVRRLIDGWGLDAACLYLGLVYGPGKAFADHWVDGLRTGTARGIGRSDNDLPLTHVEDARDNRDNRDNRDHTDHILMRQRSAPHSCRGCGARHRPPGRASPRRARRPDRRHHGRCRHDAARPVGLHCWPHGRQTCPSAPPAALVVGQVTVDIIARDAHADPAALLGTGFAFRYPSYREGVPATLVALSYAPSPAQAPRAAHA